MINIEAVFYEKIKKSLQAGTKTKYTRFPSS